MRGRREVVEPISFGTNLEISFQGAMHCSTVYGTVEQHKQPPCPGMRKKGKPENEAAFLMC